MANEAAVRSVNVQGRGKELSLADIKTAYGRSGREAPAATTYQPEFRDDVFVVGVGTETPVNELYCSTVASAAELAIILGDICVAGFLAQPCATAEGSHFTYSSDVPWLRFTNGAQRNAAQLSQYWRANSGDPGGHTAEDHAREDIAWG